MYFEHLVLGLVSSFEAPFLMVISSQYFKRTAEKQHNRSAVIEVIITCGRIYRISEILALEPNILINWSS